MRKRFSPQQHLNPQNSFAAFRAMIESPELDFLMEAHDGLSAKIVASSGFRGLWASGLAMATAMGLRDANEASLSEIIDVLDRMEQAVDIPIMLDGDTGFGNFNNVRRMVRRLCKIGIAAVCIEDKLFPKINSFFGVRQPLADIDEFTGKIRAAKDTQTNDDFTVVARVEALIAGQGMKAALERATAYRQAGADAILIHSRKPDANEILTFAREWAGRAPLAIIPTTYYTTPTAEFRDANINLIIWANHTLRASLSAMKKLTLKIAETESIADTENDIASIDEIFSIMNYKELKHSEEKYLPKK
ncbi:MAG: phosphoenolpyruvate mutase [Hyphomicrobiales bacterium]